MSTFTRTYRAWALTGLVTLLAGTAAASEESWEDLSRGVESRKKDLSILIQQAQQQGVNAEYAAVSEQVITLFQQAARNDYENMDEVRRIFKTFHHYPKIDSKWTDDLPMNELYACLDVADHAIAELKQQLDGNMTLTKSPDLFTGKMTLGASDYQRDGQPIFPYSLVWLTGEKGHREALGNMGGGYLHLSQLTEAGRPNARTAQRVLERVEQQREWNAAPMVFLMGHGAAGWMKKQHPEIVHGERNFTRYDIDSPYIRDWIKTLCAESLPQLSQACGEQPMMHLLANEPHFAIKRGGWLARNGLSDLTMQKYYGWLEAKYKKIAVLNKVYGTTYAAFDEVKFYKENPKKYRGPTAHQARQLDPNLRGGPVWYDACRFNQERVNEWFSFLKEQMQGNDGGRTAPVSIKMLGFTLSRNTRDGGMDIEYLTKLQDVIGADLRVAPAGAEFYGKHEEGMDPETGWQAQYAYDWSEQAMFLDFSKSICPEKPFYDSEWHGFGSVGWRHFNMSREYVRSALWQAFSHGMSMIKPWLWGRDENGAINDKADHIGELSTQPVAVAAYGRTMRELNAHAERVSSLVPQKRNFMIYYCEESAIQDESYTAGFKRIYESLKMLNFVTGFTTPTEISGLDSDQVVIVPPTPFISDRSVAALRAFSAAGGKVVLVGAEQSFIKTELGVARKPVRLKSVKSMPFENATDLISAFEKGLTRFKFAEPVSIKVRDQKGAKAYGVCVQQARAPDSGEVTVLLNNLSKNVRVVTLPSDQVFFDVIAGRPIENRLVLAPCKVLLLRRVQ